MVIFDKKGISHIALFFIAVSGESVKVSSSEKYSIDVLIGSILISFGEWTCDLIDT